METYLRLKVAGEKPALRNNKYNFCVNKYTHATYFILN